MELTKKQQEGLEIAIKRFQEHQKCTVISGFAGTGKSTLVRFIVAALEEYGIDPDADVVFTSFTGKACNVLQKKGNRNVLTLCKLLYDYRLIGEKQFMKTPKDTIEYKVVIVDEVSMAPMELMQQLFTHDAYVICLGDPFQLPPVDPTADNHLLDTPHVFLDEVMRQAEESEIIQITMSLRKGKNLEYFRGNEAQILPKNQISTGMLVWADQVLCATNKTRESINMTMRRLKGFEGLPQIGDKMICLRNYWDILSDDNYIPLVNGTIGYIQSIEEDTLPVYYYRKFVRNVELFKVTILTDNGETYSDIYLDKNYLLTGKKSLTYKEEARIKRQAEHYPRFNKIPQDWTYGYAITCHKSQGSEWDNVLVIEENFPFGRDEHARWVYTACTRAAEKLVLLR